MNLLADLMYKAVDPRVQLNERGDERHHAQVTAVVAPREIPHTVSPGLWTLAWRRLRNDTVAMVSLAIVVAFVLLMILSGVGVVAKDWSRETGVNYAPPTFVGPDVPAPRRRARPRRAEEAAVGWHARQTPFDSTCVDPLADVMKEIEAQKRAGRPRRSRSIRWPT